MWLTRILKAVARAMRRAARMMVRTMVWVGDKLVSMLVPAPMPMLDDGEDFETEAVDEAEASSAYMPIRNLAYAEYIGAAPTPEMIGAAGAQASDWLSMMPKPMLRSVLTATDAELRDHMSGKRTIKGLLRYDMDAIEEYRLAMMMEGMPDERQALMTMAPMRYA